jgi:predicted enzyme related to lactoylglutathione lyase
MNSSVNILNWFEISVSDMNRAKSFYQTVFSIELDQQEMMGMQMAMFPYENMHGKVAGALVQSDMHKPSTEGAVIYLNGNPDLSVALGKVEGAGGQVVMPKTHINENTGYMAFFIDSEGNKVGLHSNA